MKLCRIVRRNKAVLVLREGNLPCRLPQLYELYPKQSRRQGRLQLPMKAGLSGRDLHKSGRSLLRRDRQDFPASLGRGHTSTTNCLLAPTGVAGADLARDLGNRGPAPPGAISPLQIPPPKRPKTHRAWESNRAWLGIPRTSFPSAGRCKPSPSARCLELHRPGIRISAHLPNSLLSSMLEMSLLPCLRCEMSGKCAAQIQLWRGRANSEGTHRRS